MTAKELVEQYGDKLIGALVTTQQIGSYPGGVARVVALAPDREVPEIVYQVENPEFTDEHGEHQIGVCFNEEASLWTP